MIECLQKLVNEQREDILLWSKKKKRELQTPIYSSFDIRDNGTKASIVDCNLFPAGFNNLSVDSKQLASKYFKEFMPSLCNSKDILIIPEAHTRNLYYLSNLNALRKIASDAGCNVILGSIREDIDETLEVVDSNNERLVLEKMKNVNGTLHTKSFKGGMILLNNDFSTKAPELLQNVKSCIAPPLELGWLHRRKISFFRHFCKLLTEFSDHMDIDEWLLCPTTKEVGDIDFSSGKNVDAIAKTADDMIAMIQKKYDEYGLKERPYVFIKDNSGTYGMGIISVHSGKELLELNSQERRSMKAGKEKHPINSVIVQEGISTKYKINGGTAEPVLYMVGGKVVGGFMRTHSEKDEKESLNSPGSKFDLLLRDNITRPIVDFIDEKKELSLYSVLSDIATIAISYEMRDAK